MLNEEACSPVRWRVEGEVVAVLRADHQGQLGEPVEGVRHRALPGWRLIGLTEGAVEAVLGRAAPSATSPTPGGAGEVAPLHVVQGAGPEGNPPRAQLPLFEARRAAA